MIIRTRLSKTELKTFPDRMGVDGDIPVIVLTEEKLQSLAAFMRLDGGVYSSEEQAVCEWLKKELGE